MRFSFLFATAVLVSKVNGFAPAVNNARISTTLAMVEEVDASNEVRVGVIGCGRIGIVHLGAITKAPGVRPVIVSNPTVSKAEKAAKDFNVPKFTSDAMEVINDPDVDAVWICSPSSFHAEQIKACAANGKHVFCEKPLATDLAETVEAINACNKAGVKLMTGLQRRFDPNFRRVKEAIQAQEVGETIMIKLCSRDPSPPPFEYVKGGGGIFADMAVHDLDMSRFLAGEDPIDILAIGSCHIDKSIEVLGGSEKFDTASCIVRYPNGVQAMIDVCRQSSYGYDQRAEVLGTSGMIATDNVYPNTAKIYKTSFTGNADMPYDFFLSRYNEAYVTETVAFCESLVNDTPVPCSGQDGLAALIMALAADKSAAENRWVSFQEVVSSVYCKENDDCEVLPMEIFPEGFQMTKDPRDLLLPDVDEQKTGVRRDGVGSVPDAPDGIGKRIKNIFNGSRVEYIYNSHECYPRNTADYHDRGACKLTKGTWQSYLMSAKYLPTTEGWCYT